MMFGTLVDSLDDPVVAMRLMEALDDVALSARLGAWAAAVGRPEAELLAGAVRDFLDTADDEVWTQLVGIMTRAEDPGIAALRAVVARALPEAAA
jgi:hypothetical protein